MKRFAVWPKAAVAERHILSTISVPQTPAIGWRFSVLR